MSKYRTYYTNESEEMDTHYSEASAAGMRMPGLQKDIHGDF